MEVEEAREILKKNINSFQGEIKEAISLILFHSEAMEYDVDILTDKLELCE